jgi:osmotically-inducible protein OsmY
LHSERADVHKPSSSIESEVRDELDWDPMLDDKRTFVQASDGRVTLTGAVGSFSELLRASDDARSVRGVRTVDNELLVAPAGEAIAESPGGS